MEAAATKPRAIIDAALSWVSLGYGFFAVAVQSVRTHDDVQIAVGIEAIILAVMSFLWAGNRRNLGVALIAVGASAPVLGYVTAPLYWDEVELFDDTFWTTVGLGAAVGLPLIAIGIFILRRARPAAPRPDPWWFTPLRWVLQGGLLLMVFAFQTGDWDSGIPFVYAGAAIALIAVIVAVSRRISVTRRGIGVLLLGLGVSALLVIGLAAGALGGNVSADEAMVGVVPAVVVAGVGLLLVLSGRSRRRPSMAPVTETERPSADAVEGAMFDTLPGSQ